MKDEMFHDKERVIRSQSTYVRIPPVSRIPVSHLSVSKNTKAKATILLFLSLLFERV